MPQIAVNPTTGERLALVGGAWVPISKTAVNPDTGEQIGLINNQWTPLKQQSRQEPAQSAVLTKPVSSEVAMRQSDTAAKIAKAQADIKDIDDQLARPPRNVTEEYIIGLAKTREQRAADIGTYQDALAYMKQNGRLPPAPTAGSVVSDIVRGAPRALTQFPGQAAEGVLGLVGSGLQMLPGRDFGVGKGIKELGTAAQRSNTQFAEDIFGGRSEASKFSPGARLAAESGEAIGSTAPYLLTSGTGAVLGNLSKAGRAAKLAGEVPTAMKVAQGANYAIAAGQGSQQSGQQAQQFRDQGGNVSPGQEFAARLVGAGLGLTEVGVANRMIEKLPASARGAAIDSVSDFVTRATAGRVAPKAVFAGIKDTIQSIEQRAVGRIGLSIAEEAGQEGGVQLGQNLAAKAIYNPDQDAFEDVGKSALLGAIAGGSIKGGVEAVTGGWRSATTPTAKPEQIDLRGKAPLETIDVATPDKRDPTKSVREKLDIMSKPDADGRVIVRDAAGKLLKIPVEELDGLRVPEEGHGATPISDAFSREMIVGRVTNAAGESPTPAAAIYADKLGGKIFDSIALGKPREAADYLTAAESRFSAVRRKQAAIELATSPTGVTDPRLRVILEGKSILTDYMVEAAKQRAAPGVTVGEPTPPPTNTIAQILERNSAAREAAPGLRRDLLTKAITDPNLPWADVTRSGKETTSVLPKHEAFASELEQYGLDAPTPAETATLNRVMQRQSAKTTPPVDVGLEKRSGIVEAVLRKANLNADEKISRIYHDLMRGGMEPLSRAEEEAIAARIARRGTAENVFGLDGEYAARDVAPDVDEGVLGADETQPSELEGVPITKVAPGVARGVTETRTGQMGTQVGRPVEGAAELTAGMQDEQELTKRLDNLRKANLISDQDVGEVLNMVRVPTTKADLDALPESQRQRWKDTIDKQLEVNQRAEEYNATSGKGKKQLKRSLDILRKQLDDMRGGLAKAAQREAQARVTKRQEVLRQAKDMLAQGKISKEDFEVLRRAMRIETPMGPVLSLRSDIASELLTNPNADVDNLADVEPTISTGTEEIIAALDQAVADGMMTQEAADFAKWVLNNNPNLTRYASLFISSNTGQYYAGKYDPLTRLIEVVQGAPTDTSVHEVMHHAERLMPESAQDALYYLWKRRLNLKRRIANGEEREYLDLIHDFYFGTGNAQSILIASTMLGTTAGELQGLHGGVPRSFYQYMSPSEFWAENAAGILRKRYDVKDSVIGRIKQWLKEFASHLGEAAGIPTHSQVIIELNNLAKTTGSSRSDKLIVGIEGPAFMFGGEKATFNNFSTRTELDYAKRLASLGNDVNFGSDTHNKTGWFKADDGMWRFEFPDNDARLNKKWDALGKGETTLLREVLEHSKLFQYYPAARDIKVTKRIALFDMFRATKGWYNEKTNTINITPHAADPLSVMLHEVQHWVQGIEDFGRGGNIQSALKQAPPEILKVYKETALSRLYSKLETKRGILAIVNDVLHSGEYAAAEAAYYINPASIEYLRARRRLKDVIRVLAKAVDLADYQVPYSHVTREIEHGNGLDIAKNDIKETKLSIETLRQAEGKDIAAVLRNEPEAFEAYESLHGEVEARATQTRADFSDESRRELDPFGGEGYPPGSMIIDKDVWYRSIEAGTSAELGGRNAQRPEEMLEPDDPNYSKPDTIGLMASLQKSFKQFVADMMDKPRSTFQRKINYKYQDAVDFDKWLASAYGVDQLPEDMSVANKAELFEARKNGKQVTLDRTYIKPILNKMAELGLTMDQVGEYLWARGAVDRNALVRSRNGQFPTGGSGLLDSEALAILKNFTRAGISFELAQIGKMHDQLVDSMNNVRVQEGLLTRKQVDEFRKTQPYYASLKGFAADGDMQISGDRAPHSEEAYNRNLGIRRTESAKAGGRESMPFNPLVNMFVDAKRLVQRVEVNRVGKQLLENIMSDPGTYADVAAVYSDTDPKVRRVPNKNLSHPDGMLIRANMRNEADKYLVVKKDGVAYYVDFKETEAGRAMKRMFANMTPKELSGAMKGIIVTANFLKSLTTRFSPKYLPKALLRDVQDAVQSAYAAETDKRSPAFGKKLGTKVLAYTSATTKTGRLVNGAITRYLSGGEPKTEEQVHMSLLLEQMIEGGGSPGHAVIHDIELLTTDAVKFLKQAEGLRDKDPKAYAKAIATAIPKALDAASQFTDLKARLATYVAALEEGISEEGANRLALNSSLNLTRRGEWGRTLDAVFFFTSPSIESSRKLVNMLRSKNGRRIIVGQMLVLGAGSVIFNSLMAGGDDDDDGIPNYMEVPSGIRQANLVLFWGPGPDDYVPFPLGFMTGLPAYIGQKATETVLGDSTPGAAATSIVSAVFTTFSPVRAQGEDAPALAASVTPNLAKPPIEILFNTNYFGTNIHNKQYDTSRAASAGGRESTAEAYKYIAMGINELAGGTGTVPSKWADWAPEDYRHLVEGYGGGAYGTAKDVVNFATVDNHGDKTLVQRIPILKSYIGSGSEYAPMNKYYKHVDRMDAIARVDKNGSQDEKDENIAKFPVQTDPMVLDAYNESQSELDSLGRDQREDLSGVEDSDQRRAILDDYREQKNVIFKDFNRIYNEAEKRRR